MTRQRRLLALWSATLALAACAQQPAADPVPASTDAGLDELRNECRTPSDACVQAATRVLKSHPDAAVKAFSDACDANIAKGCVELGTAYSEGGALPQDAKRADTAFAKACRLDPLFCD